MCPIPGVQFSSANEHHLEITAESPRALALGNKYRKRWAPEAEKNTHVPMPLLMKGRVTPGSFSPWRDQSLHREASFCFSGTRDRIKQPYAGLKTMGRADLTVLTPWK